MRIQDPNGRAWTVRRRWLPWRPRRRNFDTSDALSALSDVGDLLWFAAIVFLVLVVLPVVLLVTVLVAEILLVLLLVPIFVLVRAGLTRRWPIEVIRDGRVVRLESVKGWAASSQRLEQLRADVRHGVMNDETDDGESAA